MSEKEVPKEERWFRPPLKWLLIAAGFVACNFAVNLVDWLFDRVAVEHLEYLIKLIAAGALL